ncbi:MAG: Gfo/Idh/MocA family oxidoreductase [Planctomycetota bacterium]
MSDHILESSPPGVVLVGHGPWGRNLARVLRELGALRAVVDRRAATLRAELPADVVVAASLTELAERPGLDLDAAVIATPAATHAAITLEALELGLDVLVEKPMALRLEDARTMERRARERGRLLMVGHLPLFHPAVESLLALVRRGELGAVRYVHSHRLNLGRVRREEDILFSFAPHDIALMLEIVGHDPRRVSASGGSWVAPPRADVTVTHLEFPGGVQGHVFVSWLHPSKEQRLVVVGDRGMAVFDDMAPVDKLVVTEASVALSETGEPEARSGERRAVPYDAEEPLRRECRHFLECCRTRATPRTDAAHGLRVLEVLDRARRELVSRAPATPLAADPGIF